MQITLSNLQLKESNILMLKKTIFSRQITWTEVPVFMKAKEKRNAE